MIHLIAGVPGSGKTYICNKIKEVLPNLLYAPHDDYDTKIYHRVLMTLCHTRGSNNQVLAECPFRASVLKEEVEGYGCPVNIYYLVEPLDLTIKRYEERSGKKWAKAFNTNWNKYNERQPKYNQEELFKVLVGLLSSAK